MKDFSTGIGRQTIAFGVLASGRTFGRGRQLADANDDLILQEACSLALRGLAAEGLRLLESCAGDAADAGRCSCGARDLLRARILLARNDPAYRERAAEILEDLGSAGGDTAWRAQVDLARLARDDGDFVTASTLLSRAIEAFRARPEGRGPSADTLSRLITDEVESLRRASMRGSGRDAEPGQAAAERDNPSPAKGANAAQPGTPSNPGIDRRSLLRLVELGKRLATEDDPDQVLRIVLHEAIELAGAQRGFVVTVQGEENEFALAENLDWSEIEQPSFEVSRTLIRKVVGEQKSVVLSVSDSYSETTFNRSLAEIGALSVACVPLVHERAAFGVLYLDTRDPSHVFAEATIQLLDLFAAQSAGALANAKEHQAKTRALEAAEETIRRHHTEDERRQRYEGLVGASDAMQEVYRRLDLIVPTEMPVILLGETGSGKEMAAHLIHSRGPRRKKEFVAANCAGMAETLLESELFGHERGAFTGAERTRPGLFEIAHRGTLFLDEVGDMSPRMQADLLRVLQSGEMRRVGGRETIHVDVRIIAATHRDLDSMVRRGEFRQDLFFRLNVLSLRLPPLRERADDIPALIAELMPGIVPDRPPPRFSAKAMRRLLGYPWPGNVRELQNVLRRLAVLRVDEIGEEHLPPECVAPGPRGGRAGTLQDAEDAAIERAMVAARGNKAEAARILGVDRSTLYMKLKRLDLGPRAGEPSPGAADGRWAARRHRSPIER